MHDNKGKKKIGRFNGITAKSKNGLYLVVI